MDSSTPNGVKLEGQLKTEKENKIPKLSGQVNFVSVAPAGPKWESAIITVTAIIRNTGAPSIAELSSASMEIGERTVDAVVIPPPRDQVNLLVGTKKGEGMTFLSVDFLPRKAMSQPIPTGGAVSGFIQLFVAKVEREEVYSNGIITLTFKDVLDNKYTLKSAKGDQGGRQPILNIDKLQERGY